MSASTFRLRLNDASILSQMSQVLRKDLVKPCAAKQAGIQRKEVKVMREGVFSLARDYETSGFGAPLPARGDRA